MLLSFSCPTKIVNSLSEPSNNKDIIPTRLNDLFVCRIERNQSSLWNKGWESEISDVCLPIVAL